MDDVRRLIAESEIRNLLALYAQHADDGAVREWSELFTEDATLDFGASPLQGRAALAEWLSGTLQDRPLRHLLANVAITVDSESVAHGTADLFMLAAVDGAWTLIATARYADRFVNAGEGWRFAERVLAMRSPGA